MVKHLFQQPLRAGLLLLILSLAALLLWLMWPQPQPASSQTPAPLELISAQGTVRLDDFHGRKVLLYFGYTACPDVCPTNLAIIGAALRQLSVEERAAVQAIFISIDPERDTPEHVAGYASHFHPDILGLTGSDQQIAAAAQRFGVVYARHNDPNSAMGYLVDHSAFTYLLDAQGQLLTRFDHASPTAHIVQELRSVDSQLLVQ